jgi:hypothetical protein
VVSIQYRGTIQNKTVIGHLILFGFSFFVWISTGAVRTIVCLRKRQTKVLLLPKKKNCIHINPKKLLEKKIKREKAKKRVSKKICCQRVTHIACNQ